MITINVNQKAFQFDSESTLQEILEQLSINTNGVAIAVNQSVITKHNWNTMKLSNNDHVMIIKATQGG